MNNTGNFDETTLGKILKNALNHLVDNVQPEQASQVDTSSQKEEGQKQVSKEGEQP